MGSHHLHTEHKSTQIKKALYSQQLLDEQHILSPKEKDYTFYSHPHNKYARLDYIFISEEILQN